MTDLVESAAEYLNAGLTVFPLSGKQPNTAIPGTGWREISGPVDTTADIELLSAAFEHPKTTGIGISIPSGMVVVDIDGEEGAQAFADLTGGNVDDTPVASTGRGLHLWYMTINEVRSTKLGEKLDLKGVGGYVAAPPSVHPSGAVYTWLSPLVSGGRLSAALIPEGITQLLAARAEFAPAERARTRTEYRLEGTKLVPEVVPATMVGLIRAVAEAKDGERNNMLNWAAYTARKEGFTYEQVLSDMGTAAAEAGLGEHEIKQTIRSAFRG